MINFLGFALALSTLVFCASSFAYEKDLQEYKVQSNLIIKLIDGNKDVGIISYESEALMARGEVLVTKYMKRHPQCSEYLSTAMKGMKNLDKLSLVEIERDYHSDGALPKAPAKCLHAKDLVVHPATVILLARYKVNKEGRIQMKSEILEVLAHLELVQKKLES